MEWFYREIQCDGVGEAKVKNQQECTLFRSKTGTDRPAHYLGTATIKKEMRGWRDGLVLTALERSGFSSQDLPSPLVASMSSCTCGAHKFTQVLMHTHK